MHHVWGKDRNQVTMRCLEEMVAADSSARQIDKFVDASDTTYFEKAKIKDTGRPPYDPKDMLKLYLYGMENGILSSRKLERECTRNIELMWLLNELTPESKTICNFRRDNIHNLVKFFKQFCLSLTKAGFIDGKLMALDGTKIRANNSKRNNFNKKKIDKHIDYIDQKIAQYLDDLDKADKLEELQERKAKYEDLKEQLSENEAINEISTTDPDARLMSVSNNGVEVSYNVQSVVDAKNKLIADMAVTNNAADAGQLAEVMVEVKSDLGIEEICVLADKGYYKTEDFKVCEDNNITTIVAKNDKPERDTYDVDEFTYDEENDVFICPQFQELFPSKVDSKGFKQYKNGRACKSCPHKANCTKGNQRVISRHIHKASAERNDKRLLENHELYKLRQQLVEHPFGTIKRTMGIRQFLTRGIDSVAAEVALIFLCYNLKRLRKIQQETNKNASETLSLFIQKALFFILSSISQLTQPILAKKQTSHTQFHF
jgi:transposase